MEGAEGEKEETWPKARFVLLRLFGSESQQCRHCMLSKQVPR